MAEKTIKSEVVKTLDEQLRERANEKVDIIVPLDPNNKSSLYVAINGKNVMIPRGKRFQVTRAIAEVLENSEVQAMIVNDLETKGEESVAKIN